MNPDLDEFKKALVPHFMRSVTERFVFCQHVLKIGMQVLQNADLEGSPLMAAYGLYEALKHRLTRGEIENIKALALAVDPPAGIPRM